MKLHRLGVFGQWAALALGVCAITAISPIASATDGMNPIAFDARSAAMGGADTALGISGLAMTSNPAGMSFIQSARLDGNLTTLIPSLSVTDRMGEQAINTDHSGKTSVFPLFGVAYAMPIPMVRGLTAGIGAFVQGGMGADFKGLIMDPRMPGYDVYSQVMYMKLAPTLAYRYKMLAVGASLHLGAAKMEFSHGGMMFPDGQPHKLAFESDYAFGIAGRFGAQVSLFGDKLRAGVSYMMQTKPSFEGTITVDEQAKSTGGTDDFGWAQEVALGLAGRLFNKRLTVAADFRWVNWSNAVDTVTFDVNEPANLGMPAGAAFPFAMKWQDTFVLAAGAEYAVIDKLLFVRAGYNYGRSPATPVGINPLFPPVTAHHITAGAGLYRVVGGLSVNLALELGLPGEVESNEFNQMSVDPATGNASPYRTAVEMSQFSAYLTLGYEFI